MQLFDFGTSSLGSSANYVIKKNICWLNVNFVPNIPNLNLHTVRHREHYYKEELKSEFNGKVAQNNRPNNFPVELPQSSSEMRNK